MHIHAGGNFREFLEILNKYRKPVAEFLADVGILGPRTTLGHMAITGGHSRVDYPRGDELKILAETGATIGHCPHKCAKMAFAMESFDQYLEAGVRIGLGTDTYPLDIMSEMRYASLISRLVDQNASGARAAAVFNAATIGGATALGRSDLGRLAPGAKADVVIVNLRTHALRPGARPDQRSGRIRQRRRCRNRHRRRRSRGRQRPLDAHQRRRAVRPSPSRRKPRLGQLGRRAIGTAEALNKSSRRHFRPGKIDLDLSLAASNNSRTAMSYQIRFSPLDGGELE